MNISFAPESVMSRALEILCSRKSVLAWRKSQKNGELDADGVDFVVYLKSGMVLPLQVGGPNKDVTLHTELHPHVRFVVKICCNQPELLADKLGRLMEKINEELAWLAPHKKRENRCVLITLP